MMASDDDAERDRAGPDGPDGDERPFAAPTLRDLVGSRDEQQISFQEALHAATPRVLATPALIAVNVAVFVLMLARGVSPMNPTIDDLLTWGANFGPQTLGGEPWRAVSCMFVHIGLLHVALNMWVLSSVGPLVERLLGSVGFLVLYLVSGVLASEASLWWNPLSVSAGASGAVFGVIGGLIGLLSSQRGVVPVADLARLRSSMLTFVAYNVVFGLLHGQVDMAAHGGGLLAGLALGFGMGRGDLLVRETRPGRNFVAAGVGAVAVLLASSLLPYEVGGFDARLTAFSAVESASIEAYNSARERLAAGEIDDATFASLVEREVLPPWIEAQEQLQAGPPLPAPLDGHLARLLRYAAARRESWELLAEAIRSGDPVLAERARVQQEEVQRILDETD